VCHGAAASGDLPKLQWLRTQQQCPWDDERIAAHAAESGSVAMLQWLKQQPCVVFNCWACRSALPFFDVVMYLDREGDSLTCSDYVHKLVCPQFSTCSEMIMCADITSSGDYCIRCMLLCLDRTPMARIND
jgi:hypothetical protein